MTGSLDARSRTESDALLNRSGLERYLADMVEMVAVQSGDLVRSAAMGDEAAIGIEIALFMDRLADLKIPVSVYAYGNGTHEGPYMQRDFDRSFPLILKALGE